MTSRRQLVQVPWTRRQFVRGLGFGALGLGVSDVVRARGQLTATPGRRAKSCILLFLFGGPSHIDTWDMKPNAALEYRGEFRPIATSVPGIQVCEHLPRTARLTQHLAIVRSVTMTGRVIGDGDHHADTYYVLTGHRPDRSFFVEGINRKPHDNDWPFVGSMVGWQRPHRELPAVVQLPARSGEITGYVNPGQFSGLLGPQYEPVMVRGELDRPFDLAAPQFILPAEIDVRRLSARRDLLARVDAWQRRVEQRRGPVENLSSHHRRAYELLTSARARRAFDISQEPAAIRARYGADINGQSVLLARRLVEAGVPFVCVHWIGRRVGAGLSWDTHSDNFGQLKNVLLPAFDTCFSALIHDLSQRGMLDETLVIVAAEMGRTPRVGDPRTANPALAGRDHWIHCQSALFAGGGIRGGRLYGASDPVAAYPAEHPVGPEHIAATIYRAFGIDELALQDRQGRLINLREEAEPLPLF